VGGGVGLRERGWDWIGCVYNGVYRCLRWSIDGAGLGGVDECRYSSPWCLFRVSR
jgi:hypothetical protein